MIVVASISIASIERHGVSGIEPVCKRNAAGSFGFEESGIERVSAPCCGEIRMIPVNQVLTIR